MSKLDNIAELIQTEDSPRKWVAGKDMSSINTIKEAFIEIENGFITRYSLASTRLTFSWSNYFY